MPNENMFSYETRRHGRAVTSPIGSAPTNQVLACTEKEPSEPRVRVLMLNARYGGHLGPQNLVVAMTYHEPRSLQHMLPSTESWRPRVGEHDRDAGRSSNSSTSLRSFKRIAVV